MPEFLLDDFKERNGLSTLGTRWRVISDQQQGGFSRPRIGFGEKDGTPALLLHGLVVKMNYGGWLAADLPLSKTGGHFDASAYAGVTLRVCGDGQTYAVRLQTEDTLTSKQYYEARFSATAEWKDIPLPFDAFEAVGTAKPLDAAQLTHLHLVGIEEGRVEAYVGRVGFSPPASSPPESMGKR